MKLARPDVFHPRIVLAGCAAWPEGDGDDDGLVAALRRRGLHARWFPWDDPGTLTADLVILRAARDRTDRPEEFLAWTRAVAHLLNPAPVVAWNSTRRYLADLARWGVPVSSTEGGTDGATALVFLAGEPSHVVGNGPSGAPDASHWRVARLALEAVARQFDVSPEDLLCARVEVDTGPDGPHVRALDVRDPRLGFRQLGRCERDDAERSFAVGVEGALARLGLGPLSHRGG